MPFPLISLPFIENGERQQELSKLFQFIFFLCTPYLYVEHAWILENIIRKSTKKGT
jgi:hypothetical protein